MNTNFKRREIIVIGGFNTNMVIKADKFPLPGETILGGNFLMSPGGKGANQAVAAARLKGGVTFVAKVGNDIFGRQAIQQFQREKINTQYIKIDAEYPSGVALINIDEQGENCMSVSPGSNNRLSPQDVEQALDIAEKGAVVLLQLEIPLHTVEYAIRKSYEKGLRVVLNPSPVKNLSSDLFSKIFAITPNETEAEAITGIRVTGAHSAQQAALRLQKLGVQNVIITMGSKGVYLHNHHTSQLIEVHHVTVQDTTGAGDCFNGAFAVALAEEVLLEQAVRFACKAATISTTKMGTQSAVPYREEIKETEFTELELTAFKNSIQKKVALPVGLEFTY